MHSKKHGIAAAPLVLSVAAFTPGALAVPTLRPARSSTSRALGVLGLLSLGLAHAPAYAQDVNTSPGQQAVFLSVNSKVMSLNIGNRVFPPAVLARGKKGHVLTVTATVTSFSFDDKSLAMFAVVNNLFMQPPNLSQVSTCPIAVVGSVCAATATWVADLDALERLRPGAFLGKPLTVELAVSDNANIVDTRSVSGTLIVRLERKS